MYALLVAVTLLVAVALTLGVLALGVLGVRGAQGIVRRFGLPTEWTFYVVLGLFVATFCLVVLTGDLREARANPWSLWKRSWMQDDGDAELKRVARYVTQEECLKAQWKKLEDELAQKKQVHQLLNRTVPKMATARVYLLQGQTIFEFGEFGSSLLSSALSRIPPLPDEMRLPEVVSTVSVYCAPSLRYGVWPYYTPAYHVAADDLRRLGARTLSVKAKQMLDE